MLRSRGRGRTVVAGVLSVVVTAGWAGPADASDQDRGRWFERTATYPVYRNAPVGEDPATPTVAEISAASPDGRTVVYTDALAGRIGFVDISDPARPAGLGTLSLTRLGDAEDEPTSVALVGRYVLVAVDTSASHTTPSGRLDVIELATRERVRSLDLGGQPDSIAVAPSGRYAAIAIENERDEDAPPPGGADGDLPQPPAGFVQVLGLRGADPADWPVRSVPLTTADGSPLPAFVAAGITQPGDPEPEYVTVNIADVAAVTLQENNGVVLVDLPSARVRAAFAAGAATVTGIDVADDGVVDQSGAITGLPREPDGAAWIDQRYLATANEGDWRGGTRGWSIFDTATGRVVWDAGNSFEQVAVRHGLHDEGRADNKGAEPENVVVAVYDGVRYAFVGAERGNFVVVYSLVDPVRPRLMQVLATTNGPEGLLAVPSRGLFVASSEVDEPAARVRATLSVFRLGTRPPAFPTVVSATGKTGAPIGWGALSGLSSVPGQPGRLYAVTDAAYTPTRILTLDVGRRPAVVTGAVTVTDTAGQPVGYDAEGVAAVADGGWWLAVEGASGTGNRLVRLDRLGRTVAAVPLPAEVAIGLGGQGLEGVTVVGRPGREQIWVAVQRPVRTDPVGVVRLGRYDTSTGAWAWWGYRLETTATPGDWIGLSEITAVGGRLVVIERDKLNGPDAAVKRLYAVDLPDRRPAPGTLPILSKWLVRDLLPDLRATNGWTQEKVEGFSVTGDGYAYAVTDNDGLDDATGETVLLRLGDVGRR